MASNLGTTHPLLRRRIGWSETFVLVLAALAWAAGAAAWMADADRATATAALTTATATLTSATAALPQYSDNLSFDDRFVSQSPSEPSARTGVLQTPGGFTLATGQMKLRDARDLLALKLNSGAWRAAVFGQANIREANLAQANLAEADASEADSNDAGINQARIGAIKSWASADIPLPRPRPPTASVEAPAISAPAAADMAARPDDRTMWQKLSDLVPGRITLASLGSDGGLFRRRPDLASLGYDKLTAVYDISAKTVYLPDGASLEAHSGMGPVRDDPEHVDQINVGATPPATYELKPREAPFHGVRALRMIPVDGSTLGRSGLLAHSYMLGPNGDSNGCVSFRNYDRFLKAFDNGEVNRLVVVPSLNGTQSASQRPTSQS